MIPLISFERVFFFGAACAFAAGFLGAAFFVLPDFDFAAPPLGADLPRPAEPLFVLSFYAIVISPVYYRFILSAADKKRTAAKSIPILYYNILWGGAILQLYFKLRIFC